jgi:hypothetical protein
MGRFVNRECHQGKSSGPVNRGNQGRGGGLSDNTGLKKRSVTPPAIQQQSITSYTHPNKKQDIRGTPRKLLSDSAGTSIASPPKKHTENSTPINFPDVLKDNPHTSAIPSPSFNDSKESEDASDSSSTHSSSSNSSTSDSSTMTPIRENADPLKKSVHPTTDGDGYTQALSRKAQRAVRKLHKAQQQPEPLQQQGLPPQPSSRQLLTYKAQPVLRPHTNLSGHVSHSTPRTSNVTNLPQQPPTGPEEDTLPLQSDSIDHEMVDTDTQPALSTPTTETTSDNKTQNNAKSTAPVSPKTFSNPTAKNQSTSNQSAPSTTHVTPPSQVAAPSSQHRSQAQNSNQPETPVTHNPHSQIERTIDKSIVLKRGQRRSHVHRYTLRLKIKTPKSEDDEQALIKKELFTLLDIIIRADDSSLIPPFLELDRNDRNTPDLSADFGIDDIDSFAMLKNIFFAYLQEDKTVLSGAASSWHSPPTSLHSWKKQGVP